MSLINDALKKAQKQRTGEGPDLSALPAIGGESATRIARRDKPTGFNTLVLWIGGGAAALLLLGAGGFFAVHLLTRAPEPAAVPKTVTTTAAPAKPTETAPKTADTSVAPVNPSVTIPATSAPAPAVVAATPVVETKPVVVAPVAPPPEPPKPAAPPPKMEPKAITFIEALKVTGIRASTTDSKVLMNDRVYRIGDIVEHQMDLKLAGITSTSLTFEDEKGARYTRNF